MPSTIETTEEHAHKSEHIGETNTPIRAHRRNKSCKTKTLIQAHIGETRAAV
jgi:hypothetical protein